jgi:hypothetical protein
MDTDFTEANRANRERVFDAAIFKMTGHRPSAEEVARLEPLQCGGELRGRIAI